MTRCCGMILVGLVVWFCCGCLSVLPKADCGPTPKTYDQAVAAWQKLCDRNAYLEQRNTRLERKYQEAKRDKEEYKKKYKKLKDKYED